ncbi:Uncharacterized protein APZ42_007473, partial [Daphnia magna]
CTFTTGKFVICLWTFIFFLFIFFFSPSSTYPGYARYRDLYSHNYARLLWWMESGEDVYHPHSRRSDFYPEILYSSVESRLEA